MKSKGKLLAVVLSAFMATCCLIGITACQGLSTTCTHEWSEWTVKTEATCTEKGSQERTCTKCQETEKSSIDELGHDWDEAICPTPKTCKNCSITEGAVEHLFAIETVKSEALKSNATCSSGAIYYKSCTCGAISTSDEDTFVSGSPLEHKDENKDHLCDNGCSKNDMGAHEDADKNHICDYGCATPIGQCVDVNKDHACDYGCDKAFGTCADEDKDHACDYGCNKAYGACEDKDLDHACDYGCDKAFGTCADEDKDHACDYGCNKAYGTCEDTNLDHACDYGCDKVYGTCADENKDHACDYGCDKAFGEHADGNKDHICDYGCNTKIGACEDKDLDHVCDYGCGKAFGTCEDENKDHACDYGCDKTFGEHADADSDDDHLCDYGCNAILEECLDTDNDGDHECDVCGNADITEHDYSDATCGSPATCKECLATSGTTLEHVDENHDHICDNECGKNDMGEHSDAISDGDHYCDYGCGAILEECFDTETDRDHKCDICNKDNVTNHGYVEDESLRRSATCTTVATYTYVCNCGDYYVEEDGDVLGHNITGAKAIERQISDCEYVLVYVCQRQGCGEEVYGETVYHHDYVASISTFATCTHTGEKTFKCSVCGDESKKAEIIPIDEKGGHDWTIGEVIEGVRTDTCSICRTTKTVIVSSGNSASSNASNLKDADVQLKVDEKTSANIQLGQGVADAIGNKDITISAGVVSEDTLLNMGVTTDQLAQIGENKVYDFNIKDANNENISNFGENNFVTITLPYKYVDGEDVDSIAVWFISDTCQVKDCDKGEGCTEAHKLVSIEATYNNGFVTFQTNHFSIYTVTKLTPYERCQLYGHGYVVQHVEGNCLKDEYDLYVCLRCHDKYVDANSIIIGDGHDYETETVHATCTQNGYIIYSCKDCDHSYRTQLNSIGHDWYVEDCQAATCIADGFSKYTCRNCLETYVITYAKYPHIYTHTVVEPTCTADGYTYYDCDNCTYSYTSNYVAAKGHAYKKADFIWAKDYSSATLTFVCYNDETHTTIVNATISKTVVSGTCSDFIRTTYVATATFNGDEYSDVKIVEVGTPDHNFSTSWSKDEYEHWHECNCGEKSDLGKHEFKNADINKEPTCVEDGEKVEYCDCGEEKVSIIPATGKHNYENGVCTTCGTEFVEVYYVNLINSWKNINGFAVKVENLSFDYTNKESYLSQAFAGIGNIQQLDIIELSLYIEDGQIGGAATGKVVIFNGPMYNANAVYDFKAVIYEGYVYLKLAYGKDVIDSAYNIKLTVDKYLEFILQDMGAGVASNAISLLTDTVIPVIETLLEENSQQANEILKDLFDAVFTLEKQEDDTYVAILDYQKLYVLNENLSTKPVSEVIDIYFGSGAFESLVDYVLDVLDLKLSEIPKFINDLGLNYETLVKEINAIVSNMYGTDFDFNEYVNNEDYKDVTIGMLLFECEDNSYIDDFKADIATLEKITVYELMSEMSFGGSSDGYEEESMTPEEIAKEIKDILDLISNSVTISFTTDSTGMLTGIIVNVNDLICDSEYEKVEISVDVEIEINGAVDVYWSEIVEEIENLVVLPSEDILENYATGNYEYYTSNGVMTYKDVEYEHSSIHIWANVIDYSKPALTIFLKDCDGYYNYLTNYSSIYYQFTLAQLYDGENVIMLVIDEYTGEIVEIAPIGEQTILATYQDGTQKEIEVSLGGVQDNMAFTYTNMFLAIFENPGKFVDLNGSNVDYFYNPITKEYDIETHHHIEMEKEIHGDNCDYGVTYYFTCTKCGYYDEETYYGCSDNEYGVMINLSEYSECGGYIIVDRCNTCGKISYIYNSFYNCEFGDEVYEYITDDDGNPIGYISTLTCNNCGLVFVEKIWVEYKTTCTYTYYEGYYIYKGETCIFECVNGEEEDEHDYDNTYEYLGDTCEDGYYVTESCTKCDLHNRYYSEEHITEETHVDLFDKGLCGGEIYQERCTVCDKVVKTYVESYCCWEYSHSDNGYSVYKCYNCGAFKYESRIVGEKDQNCWQEISATYFYVLNGEEVVRYSETTYTQDHNEEKSLEKYGPSCLDGFKITVYCTDCHNVEEYNYNEHVEFEEFNLGDNGCNNNHTFKVTSCPCGEEKNIYFESWNLSYDHENNTYSCYDCGLVIFSVYNQTLGDCCIYDTNEFTVYINGEYIYGTIVENITPNHNFSEYELVTEDGKTKVVATCEDCYTQSTVEYMNVVLQYNDGLYYYDYVYTPTEQGSYKLIAHTSSYVYGEVYEVSEKGNINIDYERGEGFDGNHHLTAYLQAGKTYLYRFGFYGYYEGGTLELAFTKVGKIYCEHQHENYVCLNEGSVSCEDGHICGRICSKCGDFNSCFAGFEHVEVNREVIDLSEYGACYGTYVSSSCACGQMQQNGLEASCYYEVTTNEIYDDEGHLVYVETRSCHNCGLRYTNTHYTIKDKENCKITYYFTEMISINGVLVIDKEYSMVANHHDYNIIPTLLGGEGSTCVDGVFFTYKCVDCGDELYGEYYNHETYEQERIELSDLGCACGGYMVVYGCACGDTGYVSMDHTQCDFGSEWCEVWVNGYITESQYNINGYLSFDYETYGEMYTCAVTDPSCAFKIRHASYWLKDDDACSAHRYETWQFGYDEETGTYAYQITFKCSSCVYHNYVLDSGDNYTRYVCEDCGSYYSQEYFFEDEKLVKYEKKISNTLNDGSNKYYEYVENYTYYDEEMYTSRAYEKTIDCDGYEYFEETTTLVEYYQGTFGNNGRKTTITKNNSEGVYSTSESANVMYKGYAYAIYEYYNSQDNWHKYDYTYSFDGCCYMTTYYKNNYSNDYDFTEQYCRWGEKFIALEPTCTQDGYECYECAICKTQSDLSTIYATDHDWVYVSEDEIYYCHSCGLQNDNGASGDVVLEDLTRLYGNGEYYVVGYTLNTYVDFYTYVSLVNEEIGEVMIFEGVDIIALENLRAYAISKSQIEGWANDNGVSNYLVRFTFTPVGMDGVLDYAITLTEPEYLTNNEIKGDILFVDYLTAGENKCYTITPTKDSVWTIICFAKYDTVGEIYDNEGNSIYYDDDGFGYSGDFKIVAELKAGETYTLNARYYSEMFEGKISILVRVTEAQ